MFEGNHYETGTLANALEALGRPTSEAAVLGASGGIAFGHFVFAYKGQLPHVALLARNTFSPFERALDNLAVRREIRTTTDPDKGERNLREALDFGHKPIVWADAFSLPHLGLPRRGMWLMRPLLIVGAGGEEFFAIDGLYGEVAIPFEVLKEARAKVKKDRNQLMVIEDIDGERRAEGLRSGLETACALMLDKPPAGSVDNFGVTGMQAFAKALASDKGPKAWSKSFATGPEIVQALAGTIGQPGVWDWIETWGSRDAGDRGTYAEFLLELGEPFAEMAEPFRRSAKRWKDLALAALPDDVPELAAIRLAKERLFRERRAELREELRDLTRSAAESTNVVTEAPRIKTTMAAIVEEIAAIEGEAFRRLRELVTA